MESVKQVNYAWLYDTMVIRPEWQKAISQNAAMIKENEARYRSFVKSYNPAMPWYFVGILHMMESGLNFRKHLHNGDPLAARTTHVPKGRPVAPPKNGFPVGYTWEESAADALNYIGFGKRPSWSDEEMLARFEKWNGMGYIRRNMNTPYLWSSTNHYTKGKYVQDGKFDPNAVSKQIGAAPLLKMLTQIT